MPRSPVVRNRVRIGLAEAAARQELQLRLAQVPWHVRIPLLETAAALLRYLERTYGDDRLDRLDESGIEIAFSFELTHRPDPPLAHDDFVEGAHALQAFALEHGWLDFTRATPGALSPN